MPVSARCTKTGPFAYCCSHVTSSPCWYIVELRRPSSCPPSEWYRTKYVFLNSPAPLVDPQRSCVFNPGICLLSTLTVGIGAMAYLLGAVLQIFIREHTSYWKLLFPSLMITVMGADFQFIVSNVRKRFPTSCSRLQSCTWTLVAPFLGPFSKHTDIS